MSSKANHKPRLSAIFLGNPSTNLGIGNPVNSGVGAPGSLSQLQTHPSAGVGTGLPSPPGTNSSGKESVPKRVRKTSLAFATVKSLLTGDRREHERERERERERGEEMDDQPFEDEDHTARLSGPTASTSSGGSMILGMGARSTTSSGRLDRGKSLADRNRMVLDKLSSISSAASSRLNSPAPTDRTPLTASTLRSRDLSPMPPISNNTLFPPKSNVSAGGSSPRNGPVPLASPNIRHARDLEPETPSSISRLSSTDSGGSSGKGSDPSRRPSAIARQGSAKDTPRVREIEFKTDFEQPTTPKERERLYESQRTPAPIFSVSGEGSASGIRREGSVRVSFSRSRPEMDVEEMAGNGNGPRQRVYSSESDDRSVTPPADHYSRRHVTDPVSLMSAAAGRARRVSITEPNTNKEREPMKARPAAGTIGRAGGSRSATVREPRRTGLHSRWASEDTSGDMTESPRPRYERRGGSIESPLALTGRSVVSESFRAAGLTRRRDDDEPPLSASSTRANDARTSIDWEVEQLREGIARVGVGDTSIGEEDDDDDRNDDPRTPPAHNRVASRNISQIVTSRPGTSNGNYVDDGPRTAPPALRTYRSLNTGLVTPSGSGTVRGATPVTPANLVSPGATEHVRLMLESFAMFESNLARLESNSGAVPELLQNADIVVQTSQNLNALLRRSAANAMSQQIEAEVEDRGGRELEVWKAAGGEFRDALKVCDELVRSMTNLLLGVGRVLKERGSDGEDNTRSSGRISSSEIRSGRMSADGLRNGRMSADGVRSGRVSAEGFRARPIEGPRLSEAASRILEERRNSDGRRSLDGDTLRRATSHELPRLQDPMRPQTSMSLLRERGRESPNNFNLARSSTTSSSRRFFPRQQSPAPANDADTSYETDTYLSPSPATRQLGDYRRERVLSIPPRLESVPSESIVRKAEAKATPTITRRPRISVGTVRGTMPFTTPAPAPAPTQLSTATALGNGSPDKPQRSMSYSVSRSA
ncbi:hypothetical protein FRC07_011705, partial [Ceratobasidium sp. 392]